MLPTDGFCQQFQCLTNSAVRLPQVPCCSLSGRRIISSSPTLLTNPDICSKLKQSIKDGKIKVAVGKKSHLEGKDNPLQGLFTPHQPWVSHFKSVCHTIQCICTQHTVSDDTRPTHQNIFPCKSQIQVVTWLLSSGLTPEGQSQTNPSMYENVSNMCSFSC